MKKTLSIIILSTILFLSVFSFVEAKISKVNGYLKKSGTYVIPHYKTSPNKTKFDNWSTKGNYNPFTGKKGTVDPYKIKLFKFK